MRDLVRNSKKPITGLIGGAIAYLALKVHFNLDPDLAVALSGAIAAAIVRAVGPVFGIKFTTPEATKDARGYVHLKLKPTKRKR